jgi:energy-coupling factor transporter transmembrane protein EcfT
MMGRLYDGRMPETATGRLETGRADALFLAAIAVSLVLVVVVLA